MGTSRLGVLHSMRMTLESMRLQLELLIAEDEAAMQPEQPDPKACPYCGAPEDKQVESNTLDGSKQIMCIACRKGRAA